MPAIGEKCPPRRREGCAIGRDKGKNSTVLAKFHEGWILSISSSLQETKERSHGWAK